MHLIALEWKAGHFYVIMPSKNFVILNLNHTIYLDNYQIRYSWPCHLTVASIPRFTLVWFSAWFYHDKDSKHSTKCLISVWKTWSEVNLFVFIKYIVIIQYIVYAFIIFDCVIYCFFIDALYSTKNNYLIYDKVTHYRLFLSRKCI